MKHIFNIALLLLTQLNFGQERKVYGIVKDNLGEPIPGVNVIIKGTRRGVSTDLYGKYALKVALNDTLEFSFIGMKTQKIKADKEEINIQFEEGVQLTEVLPYEPNIHLKRKINYGYIIKKDESPEYNFNFNSVNNNYIIYIPENKKQDSLDIEFQKKYILFYCPIDKYFSNRYYKKHNKLTFKYLKKKYSTTWQNEIRKDALGLNIFINKK